MPPSINQDQPNREKGPVNVLIFSGSLRKDSLNTQLAKLAVLAVERHGGKADLAGLSDFDCPSFNQDTDVSASSPVGAEEFRKRLLANDAFIIASPEYNASMPGNLKNVIDWASRF